jgi:hypothetical protein
MLYCNEVSPDHRFYCTEMSLITGFTVQRCPWSQVLLYLIIRSHSSCILILLGWCWLTIVMWWIFRGSWLTSVISAGRYVRRAMVHAIQEIYHQPCNGSQKDHHLLYHHNKLWAWYPTEMSLKLQCFVRYHRWQQLLGSLNKVRAWSSTAIILSNQCWVINAV